MRFSRILIEVADQLLDLYSAELVLNLNLMVISTAKMLYEPYTGQWRISADGQALPPAAEEGGEGGAQRQAVDGSAGNDR